MRTLLTACLCLSATAADSLVSKRDVPLQTVWWVPKKAPSIKHHEGLLHADTFTWTCYPAIGQTFKEDKKWLVLKVHIDGPDRFSRADLILSVDGEIVNLPDLDWQSMTYLGGVPLAEITLKDQDALIQKIATAKEVWITVLPGGASGATTRHSVKLSEPQIEVFREVIERYQALKP